MSYNEFKNCGQNTAVTGVSCDADIAAPARPFVTKKDFQYNTFDKANTEADHVDAITSEDVFPFPLIEEFADNSEEDTSYTSPINSVKRLVRYGKTVHQYSFIFNPSLHARFQSFNNNTMRYYYTDLKNNLIGTSPDDVVFKGFECLISVKKWGDSTGDNPAFSMVEFTILSNTERELEIAAFPASFDAKGLEGVIPAKLKASLTTPPTATDIVATVTDDSGNPITGLTDNEFRYLQADGVTEEVISGVVESSITPGEYTISATAFVTLGTLNLYDQTDNKDVITVGSLYYKGTAIIITI